MRAVVESVTFSFSKIRVLRSLQKLRAQSEEANDFCCFFSLQGASGTVPAMKNERPGRGTISAALASVQSDWQSQRGVRRHRRPAAATRPCLMMTFSAAPTQHKVGALLIFFPLFSAFCEAAETSHLFLAPDTFHHVGGACRITNTTIQLYGGINKARRVIFRCEAPNPLRHGCFFHDSRDNAPRLNYFVCQWR